MLNYIHDNFYVNITEADIAAPNRGSWWDNPIRRAVMRQFKLNYPIDVRIGYWYAYIFFPEETDKFDIYPYARVNTFLELFEAGRPVAPAAFEFRLVKVVAKKPVSDVTPRRYENRLPGRVAKTGIWWNQSGAASAK